jgi:hypothetical protein
VVDTPARREPNRGGCQAGLSAAGGVVASEVLTVTPNLSQQKATLARSASG